MSTDTYVTISGQTINAKELTPESRKKLGIKEQKIDNVEEPKKNKQKNIRKKRSKSIVNYTAESIFDSIIGWLLKPAK